MKISSEDRIIIDLFDETRELVEKHKNLIMITKADKGNASVVFDKQKYIEQSESLLSDNNTYTVINEDFTTKYQNKFNTLFKAWHRMKYIDKEIAEYLECETGTIPKFYALPKVHKDNYILKPVISSVTSPSYRLAKFYHSILKNITGKKESYIKNSEEFIKKVRNKKYLRINR